MGLFNLKNHKEEGDIKKVIETHYKVQKQIEEDLTNGQKQKAVEHIRKSMEYLTAIKRGCAEGGYENLVSEIESLRKRYDEMIDEHHLEL